MKTANPERYEESLAKMRNYRQLTKEQRLAQQKQYRSNMSEEQKEQRLAQQKQYRSNMSEEQKQQRLVQQQQYRSNLSDKLIEQNRSNDIQYQHNRRTEMRAAEIQLANSTTLFTDGTDLHVLQGFANKRIIYTLALQDRMTVIILLQNEEI